MCKNTNNEQKYTDQYFLYVLIQVIIPRAFLSAILASDSYNLPTVMPVGENEDIERTLIRKKTNKDWNQNYETICARIAEIT
jgi:hypothetical protein